MGAGADLLRMPFVANKTLTHMPRVNQPVILMRPGAANVRLAQRLDREGISSWQWPAFRITLPEYQEPVSYRLSHLDGFDMVVLASPAAVAAVAHWIRQWPPHITLATVGEGTARVIKAAWGGDTPVLYPEGEAEHSGSEALFALMKKGKIPSRVLIARGQTGREWLSEQLNALGADVEKLAAYVRVPLELSPEQTGQLQRAVRGPSPIVYITSTDSVATLLHAIRVVPAARDWLVRGVAVTIHPRCAERLREAGFECVDITGADDELVAACVKRHLAGNLSLSAW